MEEILKIVFNCSKQKRILSKSEIEDIVILLIENYKYDKFIKEINFDNNENYGLALYDFELKNINIYNNVVNRMIYNIENKIIVDDELQKKIFENLSIIQIILHELEHVNQYNIIINDNSLEALIVRLSKLIGIDNENMIYEFYPIERIAEIKSYKKIIDIYSLIDKKIIELQGLLDFELLKRDIRGYHLKNNEIIFPLLSYLIYGKKEFVLESIKLNDIKSESDILLYGLQIDSCKFKYLLKKAVHEKVKYYK